MKLSSKNQNLYISYFLIFVLLGLVMTIFTMASVPPVSRDAMTQHLAVPKLFLERGSLAGIPTLVFSYYPMNVDLLYMIPLYFHNDIVPKYIHFLFALLTAVLIYKYLKKYAGRTYGLLGVLFFLSLPVIIKLSVTVYVDLGLIFFSWTCVYYFLKWYSSDFKTRYLVYSGLACGLALGTKYNGLLVLFIMGAFTPLVYSGSKNRKLTVASQQGQYLNSIKGLGGGLLFAAAALIIFSPWMVRNYALTKNPVYPLYKSWFDTSENKSADIDLSKGMNSKLNHFQKRRYIYGESFWESISIPIRIFFQGQDDNPKYFDGRLNPFLLFFPLVAFWGVKKEKNELLNTHKKILAAFSFLYILIALFTVDMRIRYIAPVIPPLVVLSVFGVKNISDGIKKYGKHELILQLTLVVVLLYAFALNAKYLKDQFQYIDSLSYIMKKIDRETYITHYIYEYPVVKYANETLPDNASILCLLIGNRGYYIERNFHFCRQFFRRNSEGEYTETMLLDRVRENRTSHIILGADRLQQWMADNLNQKEQFVFANFFNHRTKVLYEKNGYKLLEFIDPNT